MQNKFELDKLPPELQIETAQNLSGCNLVHFAQTSKTHWALFQPMIDVHKMISKLLHHVTRGEHDAVKAMLEKDINLIFKRGFVKDCSGREFESISGFEYALWALDKHMWAAMIECIPSHEEGKTVFARLYAQYNKVNTIGVTYQLNGKTITEKHFDFENTLIKALQTQKDLADDPGQMNWSLVDKQWREGVGGAQKLVPMHVVDEYCSNEPFYPAVPQFTSQPKSSRQFYNWATGMFEYWFSDHSKLSVDFAMLKGERLVVRRCAGALQRTVVSLGTLDLGAVTALCRTRTSNFIDLKLQLEDQMTQNNHQEASKIRPN